MNIKFENLEKIDEILTILQNQEQNKIEKRWLNINETAHYLGYSSDHIHKLKNDEFIEGIHFYKKGKLLFDKLELDKWVTTNKCNTVSSKDIVNNVLKDLI